MIELVTGQEMKKNVIQIGTPKADEKIYIEEAAYGRLHLDDFHERRIFVLMGHTACADRIYETYVEAAIPVWDIEFDRQTPLWTNRIWSDVYREIRRDYESDIIVGWAYDCKGCMPKVTPELEAIHREYFGGVHQLLLLTDSIGGEECFYQSKQNHLYPKDGFYVYSGANKKQVIMPEIEIEIPKVMLQSRERTAAREMPTGRAPGRAPGRGQYRERLLKEQDKGRHVSRGEPIPKGGTSGFAVAIAIALVLGIIGTAIYKNPAQASRVRQWVETFGAHAIRFTTEQEETEQQGTVDTVPIETIDGGIPADDPTTGNGQ